MWIYVANDQIKTLLKRGNIILRQDEPRPQTPTEMKDMTPKERLYHNLNPKKIDILRQTECDYYCELLRRQMDE